MKLRVKLTVFSIALITLAIAVCCALILRFAQKREKQDITEAGIADYRSFYFSLSDALSPDLPAQDDIKRSYLVNAFRSIDGFDAFTLSKGDDAISNNVGFQVESLLQDDPSATTTGDLPIRYKTVRVNGKDYFIAHATLSAGSERYNLALARDISNIVDSLRALAAQCIAVGTMVTVLAAFAMWLIVHQSLRPIQTLKDGAAKLAQGKYENRIPIAGKDELSELAADFNSMAKAIESNIDQLNEKNVRQQAFINDLTHELKTPITSILLCTETLLGRKVSPETANRSLERIYDQGKWIESLSQKLITLVMLQGEIALQPESVPELLAAVAETTANARNESNIELRIDCSMDCLPMDFDLLRSALVNLVENARKASNGGQTIQLSAHGNEICVSDHGRGIPQEELTRVTEPFYMIDRSRNKKHGGMGLGLALVKQIAGAHGAALSIDSVLGEGTTVKLTFLSPKE